MNTIIFVLALIGSALCLTVNKEYVYSYEGKIALGIPSIRNRVVGTGMKAKITAQVQSPNKIVIKLSDVTMGKFAGDLPCDIQSSMPLRYSPISGQGRLLEQPFAINLKKSKGDVMTVSKHDIEWVTNLRKSVASIFVIDPIRGNFGVEEEEEANVMKAHNSSRPWAFTVYEPSLFGSCISEYTMYPNSSSSNHPEEHNTLFNFTRSIDFSHCKEQVILQQTGLGNASMAGRGQFEDISSRSSVIVAQLKHEEGHYILQSAHVQGQYMVNPFGVPQDKLMSITNQTYHLLSTTKMNRPIVLPEPVMSIRTWFMEVASPYAKDPHSPSWINFKNLPEAKYMPILLENAATGIPVEPEDVKKYKKDVDSLVHAAALLLTENTKIPNKPTKSSPIESNDSKILSYLETAFRTLRGLDIEAVKELFDQYYVENTTLGQMKMRIYIDLCSMSGLGAPIKQLLNEMESHRISDERIGSIFFTFANNFIASPIISDVTDYIKKLSLKENPFMTSIAWLNYASTLNRVCLNPHKHQYTTPHSIFGSSDCNSRDIIRSVMPFFKQEFVKAENPWEEVILVHAIGNLGTIEVVSTLRSIAFGKYNVNVRAAAIYAMVKQKLPMELKERVFQLLMPIVMNVKEDSYLRQAAVATLLTWSPNSSWYKAMAAHTWNEPSHDMASFIYFNVHDMAQNLDPHFEREAKIAQFALRLAKPYTPSWRFSWARFWGKFIQKDFLGSELEMDIMHSESSFVPHQFKSYFNNAFGGFRFKVFEFVMHTESMYWPDIIDTLINDLPLEWHQTIRSATNRRENKDSIMSHQSPAFDDKFTSLAFTLFDNMQVIAPIAKGSFAKLFNKDSSHFLHSVSQGKEILNMTKLFNVAPIELFIPTEIGLPLFARTSVPTINSADGTWNMTVNGKPFTTWQDLFNADHVWSNFTSNYKFATKTLTTLRVPQPWDSKMVVSGVETMKSVSLPLCFVTNFTQSSSGMKNITFHLSPMRDIGNIEVLHGHTAPFVAVKSMWPGEKTEDYELLEIITIRGNQLPSIETTVPLNQTYSGLQGKMMYEGDVAYPFTYGNLMSYISHPNKVSELMMSPTTRLWATTVSVDFEHSSTKHMYQSFGYDRDMRKMEPKPSFISPSVKSSDSYVIMSNLLLNGTETRYFESTFAVAPAKSSKGQKMTNFSFNMGRSAIPHFSDKPASVCLNMESSYPDIHDMSSLRQSLSSVMHYTTQGQMQSGVLCNNKIADIKGTLDMSSLRKQLLLKDLDKKCTSDPSDPLVALKEAPIYDEASLNIDYHEPIPHAIKNFTYHSYDIFRGWAFPHVYLNYLNVQNAKEKISVHGSRSIGEKRWSLAAKLPTENIQFDHFKIPFLFDQILPYGQFRMDSMCSSFPMITQLSNKCIISKTQVQPFNGPSYSYSPECCSTKAIGNREDRTAPRFFSSINDLTKRYEGIVGSSGTGLTLFFNSSALHVDGKRMVVTSVRTPVQSLDRKFFAYVLKTDEYMEVIVPGNFSVRLYDQKILITASPNMNMKTEGLCGTYGDKYTSLIGPTECVYSDTTLFAYAYTEYGNPGCDYAKFKYEHEKVAAFQRSCPKKHVQSKMVKKEIDDIPQDCLEYVYMIKKRGGNLCVSQKAVPMCYPVCSTEFVVKNMELYDCWTEPYAPEELVRRFKRGYIRHKITRQPIVTTSFKTDRAYICKMK